MVVLNVQYLNGPPNHVLRQFENRTKMCLKSQMFRFQMLGIQVVTVELICSKYGLEGQRVCNYFERKLYFILFLIFSGKVPKGSPRQARHHY